MAKRMNKKDLALAAMQGNLSPEQLEQVRQEEKRSRSYDRSFQKAEEAIAREQGAADGMAAAQQGGDPALERARARALGRMGGLTSTPAPQPRKSDEIIQTTSGDRIPQSVLDQGPAATKAFRDKVAEYESQKSDSNWFTNTADSMMSVIERQGGRVSQLESQLATSMQAIETLTAALGAINTTVEVNKAEGLSEASGQVAQQVTNAGAVASRLQFEAQNLEAVAANTQTANANVLQQITSAQESTLGSLRSQKQLSDLSKKELEGTVAALQQEVASSRSEVGELKNEVTNLRNANRVAAETEKVVSLATTQAYEMFETRFFSESDPVIANLRAGLGLNVATCQAQTVLNAQLLQSGAISTEQHQIMEDNLNTLKAMIDRAQARYQMPGVDPRTGDPLVTEGDVLIPDVKAAQSMVALGAELKDRNGNWTVPKVRVFEDQVGQVISVS